MPPFPGVDLDETRSSPPPVLAAATAVTAFVGLAAQGPLHEPVAIGSWTAFLQIFGDASASSTLGLAVQQYFAQGGEQALIVRLPDGARAQSAWVPTSAAARRRREGLYALDAADSFNLLCLPPPVAGRDFSARTWARAAAYCRQRRAVLLLDAPAAWHDNSAALAGMQALRTAVGPLAAAHVAVYHPRLLVADPLQADRSIHCAPGGAVAGVIARTDARRGVWKAPAGTEATLQGVLGLSLPLTDADSSVLNPVGLNSLRNMPRQQTLVWGARTLAGSDAEASEWKYLPVRRLALHVEHSVQRSTAWVVFEPNNEPLWAAVRAGVSDFLLGIWRQGGLLGAKPEEAFFVRCDRSTLTAADLAAGRLRLLIGLAPLMPAEFVLLQLALQTAD